MILRKTPTAGADDTRLPPLTPHGSFRRDALLLVLLAEGDYTLVCGPHKATVRVPEGAVQAGEKLHAAFSD